jgi:hypothetical protein
VTEADWLTCGAPEALLRYLFGHTEEQSRWFGWLRRSGPAPETPARPPVSRRKLRLLTVAYCRRVADLLVDPSSCAALEVAEQDADGLVDRQQVTKAEADAAAAAELAFDSSRSTALDAILLSNRSAHRAAANAAQAVWEAIRGRHLWTATQFAVQAATYAIDSGADAAWAVEALGVGTQLKLIRHVTGNPFCPYGAPSSWPGAVVALAEALYSGADAGFALHDALLESGYPELAEHFQAETWHPKGCWAVDAILGKR